MIRRELDDHARAQGWLAPVDLRVVPREQWERLLNHTVALPPGLAAFFAGQTKFTAQQGSKLTAWELGPLGVEVDGTHPQHSAHCG